jgi:protein phosphatase
MITEKALVTYAAAAVSDLGRKRSSNEDAFGYSLEHGVFVVCDGMGGAAAGEVASALAVEEIMGELTSELAAVPSTPTSSAQMPSAPISTQRPPREMAERAVAAANHAIFSRSQRNHALSGMGTTMVLLVVEDSRVWLLNVGDSRGYRLRHDRLEQITVDHSHVEEQVRIGRMSRAEAERSPLRNVITRALGTQNEVTPDVFELQAEPGDLFLLCSDGLTRELADLLLESILRLDLPLDQLCARLVSAANKAGGQDNITCLLVRAAQPGPSGNGKSGNGKPRPNG